MARKTKDDNVMAGDKTTAETTMAAEEEAAAENDEVKESAEGEQIAEATDEDKAVAGDEEAPSESEPSLEEQLELAQQEAAANLENWQRTAAELANFRRRQEEQLKLQRDMIKSELLQGVISALDDMDLAFQNVPEELDGQLIGWVEGFRLVQRKLDRILEEQNVTSVKAEGQFDPNMHEAISYEENEEHEEGEIIAEIRKGYQVGNRVLRPAMVRVAR